MIGSNIKAIREFKKISIETIVRRLGIFTKRYLDIEKNLIKVDNDTLKKIANILNVGYLDIINFNINELNEKQKELNYRNIEEKEVSKIESSRNIPIIKPILLTPSDVLKKDLSNQLYIENIFSAKDDSDPFNFLITTDNKTFSPRLLNYIEPYFIDGIAKSLFYSEFNTGLKKGDRVFIINGIYDSNNLVRSNKYKRGRDGYKVLFIDNCKIVLDINYTGKKPWKEEDPIIGYPINLYYVKNYDDFKSVNRQISTSSGSVNNKFNFNNHNFIYVDKDYNSVSGWGQNNGLIGGPGFFVRNGFNGWINVTNEFLLGNLNSVISPNIEFNGRIKVVDGEFTYILPNEEELFFEEGKTYKFDLIDTDDETYPRWILDIDYNRVFITKANFRNGKFNGVFNTGLYGNADTTIKWNSPPAKWNSGTLYNVYWERGEFNSIYTLKDSYYSELDSNGNAIQKINGFNNGGRGYSLIVDSIVDNMIINNATIINSYFSESATYSTVSDYVNNINTPFNLNIKRGYFINCVFENCKIENSLLDNSKTINSLLINVRSVSTDHKNVVIDNSAIVNKSSIKIIGYDEFNLSVNNLKNDISHKVYKFYVNEFEFNKLKFGDYFYLNGINVNNELFNFFDKKFKVSSWTEYVDYFSGDLTSLPPNIPNNTFYKRGIELSVFLSSPLDNSKLYNSYRQTPLLVNTVTFGDNPNKLYSIDIVVSTYDIDGIKIIPSDKFDDLNLDFNVERKISTSLDPSMPKTKSFTIDFNTTFIVKGNIESGIVNNTDWNFGNQIESNNDLCITPITNQEGEAAIELNSSNNLVITINRNIDFNELKLNSVKKYDIVYLNSIYYKLNDEFIRIPDTYEVIHITDTQLILKEIGTNILTNLTPGGMFTTKLENRYNYIHLTKVINSVLKEGIFNRSYLNNNLISNVNLDIEDKDFNKVSNIKALSIVNSLFDDNGNKLNKATYINSHIKEGTDSWINGILYESIWNNSIFNMGLFKKSTWLDGIFNSGIFYQSNSYNDIPTVMSPSIDINQVYSYYRKGETNVPNNKYSWLNGTFNGGDFELSDFENGIFNNGNLFHSNFYDGIINNGVIGKNNLSVNQTNVFNGIIEYCTVVNASVVAKDTSLLANTRKNIRWKNGVFENGIFGNILFSTAVWESGIFNGGEFTDTAKWKNGTFNNGYFLSSYGSNLFNTIDVKNYTWESGVFNGGIFGTLDPIKNSLWFDGEFNGGKFTGKVWNDGIFTGGEFIGSATYSATIDISTPIDVKLTNTQQFVDSFKSNFYGLWRNGIVSTEKDRQIKDKDVSNTNSKDISFKNILWLNGTFSYLEGKFENSIWLNGKFEKGIFTKSSFNPFVKRGTNIESFEETDSCIWLNGNLKDSDFYYSEWKDGLYQRGNSYGMIWNNGLNEYMNAFNIWWKDGLWRNGNWYGSFIEYSGKLEGNNRRTLFDRKLLDRVANAKEDSNIHIWNIFKDQVVAKGVSYGSAGVIVDSEEVEVLTTYYSLKSCSTNDIKVYYTNIMPPIGTDHISNQQFKTPNNSFYTYDNKPPISIITPPDNFITAIELIPNTIGCPVEYYKLESCLPNDTTVYYTNIKPEGLNQRYSQGLSPNAFYYTFTGESETFATLPSTFRSVNLDFGKFECSECPDGISQLTTYYELAGCNSSDYAYTAIPPTLQNGQRYVLPSIEPIFYTYTGAPGIQQCSVPIGYNGSINQTNFTGCP